MRTIRTLLFLVASAATVACTATDRGAVGLGGADAGSDSAFDRDVDIDGTGPGADADEPDATDVAPDADGGRRDTATADPSDAADADEATDTDAEPTETGTDTEVSDGSDASADAPPSDAVDGEPDAPVVDRARRIVVAGDSWSAGVVFPIIAELAERGLDDIVVTYETTAIGGTRAEQWATNAGGLRDALIAALDAEPPADVLWLSIGGNDFLGSAADGLGRLSTSTQLAVLDGIRDDVRTILETATHGRPELTVVIAGYDYLQFLFIEAVLGDVEAMDMTEFNALMIELERRKRDLASSMPNVEYAHNIGLLQHVYGDGLYLPGAAPKPGWPPAYTPFPGGFPLLPSPAASYSIDGIHPTGDGYRVIVDNVFDQGLQRLLEVDRWEAP